MFTCLTFFILLFFSSCEQHDTEKNEYSGLFSLENDSSAVIPDTLHVATMYGSSSYFYFRENIMGYDYELINHFATSNNLILKIHLAQSKTEMLQLLENKVVDLIAYNVYETKPLKKKFKFVFPQEDSYMVLVQLIGLKSISQLNELKEKTVHVIDGTIYHQRMRNLQKEMGGGMKIVVLPDTLTVDETIDLVAQKKIDFTIAHYNTAMQYKDFNRRLDCHIPLGFNQKNGWLINKHDIDLDIALKKWMKMPETELFKSRLYGRYRTKNPYFVSSNRIRVPKGAISPYDDIFKKYATEINWDWRLLASIAFHESSFDSAQISRKGASGLMQLMPRTAASFGLNIDSILYPEKNIEASVQYIKSLNMMFRKIEDIDERNKFILAAYNAGPAHIFDAMALANKYGRNPHIWFEHVEFYLSKKSDPDYYTDEVVRFGSFGSKETINYVRNTLDTYNRFRGKI